jgi:hypothetical protein
MNNYRWLHWGVNDPQYADGLQYADPLYADLQYADNLYADPMYADNLYAVMTC